jgi:hypothetical protein
LGAKRVTLLSEEVSPSRALGLELLAHRLEVRALTSEHRSPINGRLRQPGNSVDHDLAHLLAVGRQPRVFGLPLEALFLSPDALLPLLLARPHLRLSARELLLACPHLRLEPLLLAKCSEHAIIHAEPRVSYPARATRRTTAV